MTFKTVGEIQVTGASKKKIGKDLDRTLDKSSKKFSRTFAKDFSGAIKKGAKTAAIVGGAIGGAALAALTLIQKQADQAQSVQEKRANQAQQIQTIATVAGEDPAQVAGLVQGLQEQGFTFDEATSSVANFVDRLNSARLGQDQRLINFTADKDLNTAFNNFIAGLQQQDVAVAQAQQGGILAGNAPAQARLLTGESGSFQAEPDPELGKEIGRVASEAFATQIAQQQLELAAFTNDLKEINAKTLAVETNNVNRQLSKDSLLLASLETLAIASDKSKDIQLALTNATLELTTATIKLADNFSPAKISEAIRTTTVTGTTGLGDFRNATVAPRRSAGQRNREGGE